MLGAEPLGILCRRANILTFQLTANVGLSREGGGIKSCEIILGGREIQRGASFYPSFCLKGHYYV